MLSGAEKGDLEFGEFRLEPSELRLTRGDVAVDLNGRYLDALLLLARHPGELITKDRFMAEVWRGVPVTDEALTQCIRSLRKALGDDAARPRFIETVPRHGYRFLAEVRSVTRPAAQTPSTLQLNADTIDELKPGSSFKSRDGASVLLLAAAGLAGGAAAGLAGGIGYGLVAATAPPPGTGASSILLVLTCLCMAVGLLGGLGVGGGIALGRLLAPGRLFPVMLGGALGGLVIGTLGRLVGIDAFALLVGSRPVAITGASEGLIIGALAGAALWLAERDRRASPERAAAIGGLTGALAGLLVTFGGGTMMAGSLVGLAAAHPDAPLGALLGTPAPWLLLAAGVVEGALFVAAVTLALTVALRSRG